MPELAKWKITTWVALIAVASNIVTFIWAASSFRESVIIRISHIEASEVDRETRIRILERELPKISSDVSWIKLSLQRIIENGK